MVLVVITVVFVFVVVVVVIIIITTGTVALVASIEVASMKGSEDVKATPINKTKRKDVS